jgi:predicted dehydrogenase
MSTPSQPLRFGIVGLGGMGSFHLGYLNEIDGARVAAVCDAFPDKVEQAHAKAEALRRKHHPDAPEVVKFNRYQDLIESGAVDAVLIATPHFQHPEICIAAFARGVHVLSEKPLAVHVKDARAAIAAHAKAPRPTQFGLMLQMRTLPLYNKIRSLIQEGDLGEITRFTWIVTDWFRTWTYYASGGWRATWSGEGGGVLINQCPHNLDLIPWLSGMMPSRVTAVAQIGKTHPVEVEDEVSAILEFPNGATGHFVTTTGEAPGTNRLEIAGDRGKLVAEKGKLGFTRTRKSVREVREQSPESFAQVEAWDIDIPLAAAPAEPHKIITQNFVNACRTGETLIAPGTDGAKGLEIGNAMLMAGVTRRPVELPLDGDAYEQLLKDLNKQYGGRKTLEKREAKVDMGASFAKP